MIDDIPVQPAPAPVSFRRGAITIVVVGPDTDVADAVRMVLAEHSWDGTDAIDASAASSAGRVGVTLHDAAAWLPRPMGLTPAGLVKRWSDSSRPRPPEIGRCPHDGRRKLSEIGSVVRFVASAESLEIDEIRGLREHLADRARSPIAEKSSEVVGEAAGDG